MTAGKDLVLLHGWGMHGGVWDGVRPLLEERGLRVHAVDLPGYGGSAAAAPYALESIAAGLAARFPGPVRVCGWSLGGMVALRWALDFPAGVERLVLVASTPRFVSGEDWPHGMEPRTLRAFADGLAGDYEGTLKRFLSLQARGDDEAREVTRALRSSLFERGRPDDAALQGGLAILRDSDLRNDVASLRCPALVIHGDRDMLTPLPAGRWLSQRVPHGRLAVVAGASHAPFLSHRGEFARLAGEFLHG